MGQLHKSHSYNSNKTIHSSTEAFGITVQHYGSQAQNAIYLHRSRKTIQLYDTGLAGQINGLISGFIART